MTIQIKCKTNRNDKICNHYKINITTECNKSVVWADVLFTQSPQRAIERADTVNLHIRGSTAICMRIIINI